MGNVMAGAALLPGKLVSPEYGGISGEVEQSVGERLERVSHHLLSENEA